MEHKNLTSVFDNISKYNQIILPLADYDQLQKISNKNSL